jgi:hypothetical protein
MAFANSEREGIGGSPVWGGGREGALFSLRRSVTANSFAAFIQTRRILRFHKVGQATVALLDQHDTLLEITKKWRWN